MSNDYLLDKRILLVDDEQELLDMVHSILDEYGFHHIIQQKHRGSHSASKKSPRN